MERQPKTKHENETNKHPRRQHSIYSWWDAVAEFRMETLTDVVSVYTLAPPIIRLLDSRIVALVLAAMHA